MAQDELAQGRALWPFPPIGLDNGRGVAFGHGIDESLAVFKHPPALHRFE